MARWNQVDVLDVLASAKEDFLIRLAAAHVLSKDERDAVERARAKRG